MQKLHPGAKWLFRFRAYTSMVFIIFFISVVSLSALIDTTNIGLISLLIVWILIALIFIIIIGETYARLAYRFWLYEFTDSQLRLERGIIWKKYSNIPYERVQNVDIQRGIIARLLGFSSINIQTAGYSMPAGRNYGGWSEGYIPAVSKDEAENIREFVVKKVSRSKRHQGL